jgi:type I restriction enzyme S subunit
MSKTIESELKGELRRFKSYPAYKESGAEWLGEIPAGWEVKRLKEVATIQMSNVDKKSVEGEEPVELCNYTDVYYHDRITSDMTFMKATAPREQVRRFALRAGDVLITKDSESWTDIAVPAVVTEDMPNVLCGYHLAHIRPSAAVHGPYLSRAIGAVGPRDQFRVAANGVTRFAIGTEAVTTSVFAVPSLPEQRAISTFLDRESARIDELVAKKERLITLLQERRTALITRAVTRGLNPAAPMKDSGVEWLGEIPAHWEVQKATWIFSIGSGTTPSSDYPAYFGGDIPWITTSELRESEIWSTEKYVSKLALSDYSSLKIHPAGSIAVAMYGATIGRLGILRVPATTNQACCVFSEPKGVEPQFWYYWLQMYRPFLISLGYGGGQPNLSQDLLRSMRVPLPPVSEQQQIVEFLDGATVRVDSLVQRVRTAINRLHEFRAALISAAVTGKIDVRYSSDPATNADTNA